MKKLIKIIGCTLVAFFVMNSCKKDDYSLLPDIGESNIDNSIPGNFMKVGENFVFPVSASLTNVVSENFESGGKIYYCYQLKLEKSYPAQVDLQSGGGNADLSYSINFKFFAEQADNIGDNEFNVEILDGILPYFEPLEHNHVVDKSAVAYMFGDINLNPELDSDEYENYLKSQIRVKSGIIQIKKPGELYVVTFDGLSETGEKVSCHYRGNISSFNDSDFESWTEDYSLTEIPGDYIKKGDRYYKLTNSYIYVTPDYFGDSNKKHVVIGCSRDYYRYEQNYAGLIEKHWKSNGMNLNFQYSDLSQLQPGTYNVVAETDMYVEGDEGTWFYKGLPNDSSVVSYYHVSTEPHEYFLEDNTRQISVPQIALQSGKLQITSDYEVTGSFIDADGEQVIVKFKAVPNPGVF